MSLKLKKKLQKFIKKEKDQKVLDQCNQIIRTKNFNADIILTKLIALILLGRFDSVIKLKSEGFNFEKAYAFFRKNYLKKAIECIGASDCAKNKLLKAQIYYKLKEYEKADLIYQNIKEKSIEIETNIIAVKLNKYADTCCSEISNDFSSIIDHKNCEWETLYNKALFLSQICQNFYQSNKVLDIALDKAKKMLNLKTENDIFNELWNLLLLKAINFIALEEDTKAFKLLENGEKELKNSKFSKLFKINKTVLQLSENNSNRYFQRIRALSLDNKSLNELSFFQMRSISLNRKLVYYYSRKIKNLKKLKNDSEILFNAATTQIFKNHEDDWIEKTIKTIESYKNNNLLKNLNEINDQLTVRFALSFINSKKTDYNVFKDINNNYLSLQLPYRYLPKLVLIICKLIDEKISINIDQQRKKIFEIINNAIEYWSTEKKFSENENFFIKNKNKFCLFLLKEAGNFCLEKKLFAKAAHYFEKIIESDIYQPDEDLLAKYVLSLSYFNPQKALKKLNLVQQKKTYSSSETEKLYNAQISDKKIIKTYSRHKKSNKTNLDTKDVPKDVKLDENKKKMGSNRKIEIIDKNGEKIDPERWIPLKERSYYQHKNFKRKQKLKSKKNRQRKR